MLKNEIQEAEAARQRSETLRNEAIRLVEDRHVRTNRFKIITIIKIIMIIVSLCNVFPQNVSRGLI